MKQIDPAVLAQAAELRRQFESAQPFRHVVVDNFLRRDFCQALVREFPEFDARQAQNELGEPGRKAVHPNLKALGPAYGEFDRLMQAPEFLEFVGAVTGIPRLLYDPEYVGGGTHENLDGQELDTHVDFNYHPTTRTHRRLNLILFLNAEWRPEWGGLLELQRDPSLPAAQNVVSEVLPLENRCVIFETTETSWHGFRRVTLPDDRQDLSRKSLAVYFYTKERPKEETAPSHGTVYIPRPIPEFVRAGHVLSEADVHELEVQFARREAQIQYLYEREKEFARIAQSPSFRLARALTWPLRKIREIGMMKA